MKAAIYCRLSEEDRNKFSECSDSESIKNQKSMLLSYAEKQGWEICRIYSDDDYAGADRKRPEFNRLLEDARCHKFDIILCKTQSRFTRELELVEKYIHGLFPLWGIRFVSIVDNADTENKGNKKSRQINGLVNEWYLEDMSENIRSVLINRRENGLHIGAFALYGYKKNPEQKGHLIIDEEAAVIVREVFLLFSKGYGKTAIARILNDRGVPNPTEYKRLCGLRYRQPAGKNSTLWKYPAISDMLTNEMYIGNMVQGRCGSESYKTKKNKSKPKSEWYIVEHTHEPIIAKELWDRVQILVAQKAKPFASGSKGLFAGKVRCMNCGYAMRSVKNRGKHYLQCTSRHIAKDACIGAFIAADWLEQIVIAELKRLTDLYLDKDELEQKIKSNDGLKQQREIILSNIENCEKRSDDYRKGLSEIYMDKVRGLIKENDFVQMSEELAAEKECLERAVIQYGQQLTEINRRINMADSRRELVKQYIDMENLNCETVETMIDYICVGKRIPGTRQVPVEIHWNF